MHINLPALLQKYVLRPAERLRTTWLIPTVISLPLMFAAFIVLVVLYPHPNEIPWWLFALQIILFLTPFLGGTAIMILSEFYEGNYDKNRDLKLAHRLHTILLEKGQLPTTTLRQHYNSRHIVRLPRDIDHIATRPYTRHLFNYDHLRHIIGATNNPNTHRDIPYPVEGDYQTAYYQLYARLRAIREHPELATAQDSLIDDLYGIN